MTTTNGSWTQGYMYDYNLSGNQILKRSIDSENNIFDDTTYTYDNLGQLLSETSPNYYAVYMYDTRGNRSKIKEGNSYWKNYTYDANNRIIRTTQQADDSNDIYENYTYDANGNCLTMRRSYYCDDGDNSGETGYDEFKYGYDAYNRQISYYNYEVDYVGDYEDETTATYTYDAIGRRASKKVDGATTTHRWDGSSIVGDSGTGAATYYRGINIIAQNKNNAVNYYVYDGHGNTVTLTDANGATISKCDYSAYGNRTSIKSYINTPFKYCGEYQDNESGMVYLRNRYYKINEGRFTQEDPAKDGLNWYAYCGNNPVNFVDPSGLVNVEDQDPIQDYCSNQGEITGQERKNINSAILAYKNGFLSKNDMLNNVAQNGGVVKKSYKGKAVIVEMKGNTLNITIYADITGIKSKSGKDITREYKEGLGQIMKEGIEENWSGEVDGVYIKVNVIMGASNTNRVIEINLNESSGAAGSTGNHMKGSADINFVNPLNINEVSANEKAHYIDRFQRTCEHEIVGHVVANLVDTYTGGVNSKKPLNQESIASVMNEQAPYHHQKVDLAFLLFNYKRSRFGSQIQYGDYPDILDKYAPGWKYE